MATMKDIAKLSGVSRGTVDRVLNHRGIVSPDTRKKVLEIAKLLDYHPNRAGIALAAQKKKLKTGVLLSGPGNPFFDEVMDGLNHRLAELSIYGCSVVEKRIPFDPSLQLEAMDELLRQNIHGLILSPCNDAAVRTKINALRESGIPCVTVNTDLPDSGRIAYVGSDYYRCGQTAAGLLNLITGGRAVVGIVTGSHRVLCHEERINGFTDYLRNKCPGIHVSDIIENDDDDDKSYRLLSALLKRRADISALYFTAAGVHGGCRAILNASLTCAPKVVTFDAVPSTRQMIECGVISATICQQPREQGARSLSILTDYLLTGKLPEQTLHHMDLSIRIRENL